MVWFLYLYAIGVRRGADAFQPKQVDVAGAAFIAWIVAASLFLSLFQHSENYPKVVMPLQFALCATFFQAVVHSWRPYWKIAALVGLVLLVLINSAFWPVRTYNYLKLGVPDQRAQLKEFYCDLPPARLTLLPVKLWQAASMHLERHALLTSPSFNMSYEYREKYERFVGEQLRPGDLVIYDDQFRAQPTVYLNPGLLLEPVDRHSHLLTFPSGKTAGYDMLVYRVVEEASASPQSIKPPKPGKRAHPGF